MDLPLLFENIQSRGNLGFCRLSQDEPTQTPILEKVLSSNTFLLSSQCSPSRQWEIYSICSMTGTFLVVFCKGAQLSLCKFPISSPLQDPTYAYILIKSNFISFTNKLFRMHTYCIKARSTCETKCLWQRLWMHQDFYSILLKIQKGISLLL